MDNEWKNSLRERFSDYSAPEPEGLWEGIEQGIAGKPRRKMLPVWLVSGAAVAAAVTLVVFLHPEKTLQEADLQKQGNLAESVLADVAQDEPASEPVGEPVAEPVEAPVSKPVPFAVASRQTLLSEAATVPSVPVSEDRVPDAVHEMPDQVGHDEPTVTEAVQAKKDAWEDAPEIKDEMVVIGYGAGRKKFSVSAYGNGGQASSEQSKGYGMNRTSAYLTRSTGGGGQKDVGGAVRMLSANRASTFEAHHAAPLRVGLTASYGLTRHLNLVSGLNWTYLNSEFEETAGSFRAVTSQELG